MKVDSFELSNAEIRQELDKIRHDFSIAICRAKNAFNIGAIIRTAHSFLPKEIFLMGTESFYERAAMGMQKYENIIHSRDEEDFLKFIEGRPLIGIEREDGSACIWNAEFPPNLVFLFGSENDGIPIELRKACSQIVTIPMYGINHSYPVTAAAAMTMIEWARRHDPRGKNR